MPYGRRDIDPAKLVCPINQGEDGSFRPCIHDTCAWWDEMARACGVRSISRVLGAIVSSIRQQGNIEEDR